MTQVRLPGLAITAFVLLTLYGCATAQRAGALPDNAEPREPFLVEVSDRIPAGAYSIVSVATRPPRRGAKLPATLDDGELELERSFAGNHGAEFLAVERVDNAYRRVFYLLGLRQQSLAAGTGTQTQASGPPLRTPQCAQPDLDTMLADARRRVGRCVAQLREARPALAGTLKIRIEIDRFGGIYAADITPESSRDGQLQRCAKRAIYETRIGAQRALMCHVEVDLTP